MHNFTINQERHLFRRSRREKICHLKESYHENKHKREHEKKLLLIAIG